MIMMKVKMKVMKVKVMKSDSESYPSSLVVPGHMMIMMKVKMKVKVMKVKVIVKATQAVLLS